MKQNIYLIMTAILITISVIFIVPTLDNKPIEEYQELELKPPVIKESYFEIAEWNNNISYYKAIEDISLDLFYYDTVTCAMRYDIHYKYFIFPVYYIPDSKTYKYDTIYTGTDLAELKDILITLFKNR